MTQTAKQFFFYFIYFSIFTSLNILWFKVVPDHNNILCHRLSPLFDHFIICPQFKSDQIGFQSKQPFEEYFRGQSRYFNLLMRFTLGGRWIWIMISNRRFPISKIAFKSFPIVEVRILSVCRLNAKPLHGRTKHSVSFTNVLNVLKHSVSFP